MVSLRYYKRKQNSYQLEAEITFRDLDTFWDYIDRIAKPKTRLVLFAHNQHYDFFILSTIFHLKKRGYELKEFSFDTQLFFARFQNKDRKTLMFLDTMNFFKTSLEEMGKAIGMEKQKVDFYSVDDKTLEQYNRRDVEILAEYSLRFIEWWKREKLGKFGISIAQLALNAYRHRFMDKKICIHRNQKAIELERQAYFGGRCECFRIGSYDQKIYKLDVNSMYPFVMKDNPFPTKLVGIIENPDITYIKKLLYSGYCLICEVTINTEEPAYPYRGKRLLFPVGLFKTYLATPELVYALANNHIQQIHRCSIYKADKIFTTFIEYFYTKKKEAEKHNNKLERNFYKLIMNSLYGKFGQAIYTYKEIEYPATISYGSELAIDIETNERYKVLFIDGKPYRREKTPQLAYHTFIAIPSHVTSYARIYLWKLIKTAEIDNVFYVDTDSLFVNEKGYSNLKEYIGNELGQLKVEGVYNHGEFYLPKFYVLGEEVKRKGLTKHAIEIEPWTFQDLRFWRSLSLLSKGIYSNVIVEKTIKHISPIYRKGKVLEDGRVIPWRIPEDIEEMERLDIL
jgi:DNA polymerase elongation subunit (family B)